VVYVKRNEKGEVCALYNERSEQTFEQLPLDSAEISTFLAQTDDLSKWEFIKSDLELIRVFEDLVEILIDKRIITITDFPTEAIEKLLARKHIREQLTDAIGFIDDEDSERLI
jgi:FMN phosphatase YigB (HAD superfamily)